MDLMVRVIQSIGLKPHVQAQRDISVSAHIGSYRLIAAAVERQSRVEKAQVRQQQNHSFTQENLYLQHC